MSLTKRGNTWWIDFTSPSGERIRRTSGTENKVEAQEFHDKLKAECWRVQKLGEKPRYIWDQAGYRWLQETEHKRTHQEDIRKLLWLQQFLRGRILVEITRDEITAIGEFKKRESSGATANRYLALIRSILLKACNEWEWIDKAPKVKMYKELKRRVRWITPDQVRKLLDELPYHQQEVTVFALATGLRQANVLQLTWQQVDLARSTAWIFGDQAKGKEDIHVSLSQLAVDLLNRQIGNHQERVFTYKGKPIGQINTKAWRNALMRAGIVNFRWHDLRHTWASWLVQNGTPLYNLQEMGGWKSGEMVRRYAHLAPAQMSKHAEVVGKLLYDTNAAQLQEQSCL
jgi:integrase